MDSLSSESIHPGQDFSRGLLRLGGLDVGACAVSWGWNPGALWLPLSISSLHSESIFEKLSPKREGAMVFWRRGLSFAFVCFLMERADEAAGK